MADGRRIGHAQRRRIGAASNVYDTTMPPPAFGVGDSVKASGRYKGQTVVGVVPGHFGAPGPDGDGHGYVVEGGKSGRQSIHASGQISPFQTGVAENGSCGYCGGLGMAPGGATCPSCGGSGHAGG